VSVDDNDVDADGDDERNRERERRGREQKKKRKKTSPNTLATSSLLITETTSWRRLERKKQA
jgi:hypothetical protein